MALLAAVVMLGFTSSQRDQAAKFAVEPVKRAVYDGQLQV
jgi:hypothetical protein